MIFTRRDPGAPWLSTQDRCSNAETVNAYLPQGSKSRVRAAARRPRMRQNADRWPAAVSSLLRLLVRLRFSAPNPPGEIQYLPHPRRPGTVAEDAGLGPPCLNFAMTR